MSTLGMVVQGSGWCPWCAQHMSGWGWTMMLFWLVLLAALVALAWVLAKQRWSRAGAEPGATVDRAQDILRERYARGEIDGETYRRMLDELNK